MFNEGLQRNTIILQAFLNPVIKHLEISDDINSSAEKHCMHYV